MVSRATLGCTSKRARPAAPGFTAEPVVAAAHNNRAVGMAEDDDGGGAVARAATSSAVGRPSSWPWLT